MAYFVLSNLCSYKYIVHINVIMFFSKHKIYRFMRYLCVQLWKTNVMHTIRNFIDIIKYNNILYAFYMLLPFLFLCIYR